MRAFSFVFPFVVASALLACTTKTIQYTTGDGGVGGRGAPAEREGGEAEEDEGIDAGARDAKAAATPPVDLPDDPPVPPVSVPVTGGTITLTCPTSGFHQPSPIVLKSLPSSLLPRCSATTKSCALAATTGIEWDTCLASDTTTPVTFDGESVDCAACDRTQGAYCMASACSSEFTAYGCCVQENGDAACAGLLSAVTSCAGGSGKVAFEACIDSLVGACFP